MKKKTKRKYCNYCGTRCKTHDIGGGYSTQTGEKLYGFVYQCPKKKWWEFWHVVEPDWDF